MLDDFQEPPYDPTDESLMDKYVAGDMRAAQTLYLRHIAWIQANIRAVGDAEVGLKDPSEVRDGIDLGFYSTLKVRIDGNLPLPTFRERWRRKALTRIKYPRDRRRGQRGNQPEQAEEGKGRRSDPIPMDSEDLAALRGAVEPDPVADAVANADLINFALSQLSVAKQIVIYHSFVETTYLENGEPKKWTQARIGEHLGFTQERVAQLKREGLDELNAIIEGGGGCG